MKNENNNSKKFVFGNERFGGSYTPGEFEFNFPEDMSREEFEKIFTSRMKAFQKRGNEFAEEFFESSSKSRKEKLKTLSIRVKPHTKEFFKNNSILSPRDVLEMYDEFPHSLMTDFRDEFKLLLEKSFVSGKGTDEEIYKGMMSFLNKVGPNIPERLYRYRKIDEKGYTLKAFGNGTVSVCKPKCFSDKYDSLIFVDTEKQISEMREASKLALRKVLSDIKKHNPRLRAGKVSQICYYMEQGMSDNDIIAEYY